MPGLESLFGPQASQDDYPVLPKTEITLIGDQAAKATQRIRAFSQKYLPPVVKHATKFEAIYNDLIVEPQLNSSASFSSTSSGGGGGKQPMECGEDEGGNGERGAKPAEEAMVEQNNEPELSVHAQYLLMEALNNLRKTVGEMSQEHKHPIHHLISRCGKVIDSKFHADISKLLKNEKDIEHDAANLAQANRLIYEHFMGLGRTEVAQTFLKESGMSLKPPEIANFDTLREVMHSFRQHDYLPAIEWVKANAPDRRDLLFRLQCQHVVGLLESNNKMAALSYVKELQNFTLDEYKQEFAHLMFVVISYPKKGPYEYFFHEGRWFTLEQELTHALTVYRSSLSAILTVGAKTVPSLMTMRAFLASTRPSSFPTLPDELPCTVPIPEQVHSSFCCPILKVQSTENNPPVRLCCGHVISTDAMTKLAQQSRNNRLKCPYCPLESVLQETKQLHF